MSALFSKPSIPRPPLPVPPKPVQNTPLEAQLQQIGQRQGLVATLFGYKNPAGPTAGKKLTGE